jgi:hypothetical protein
MIVVRQSWLAVAALLILVSGCSQASEFDTKVKAVTAAADQFVVLAKDSAATGEAPRESDPAAKPLLDLVLDTTSLQTGPVQPMSELEALNDWNLDVVKVGLVYILAGTGVTDIAALPNTPDVMAKINANTIKYAPEMGRYIDAQLRLQGALIDTISTYMATAAQSDLDQANFKSGLAQVRSGVAGTLNGAVTTFPTEGLTDAWRRDRLAALLAIGPRAAKFLLPEDVKSLHDTATEVAGQMSDPEVKAGLASFAATLESSPANPSPQ